MAGWILDVRYKEPQLVVNFVVFFFKNVAYHNHLLKALENALKAV